MIKKILLHIVYIISFVSLASCTYCFHKKPWSHNETKSPEQTESETELKSFPDLDQIYMTIIKYVEYNEKCQYDSLAELYAPIVEQYDDKHAISRNDVVYYTRRKIEDHNIRNYSLNVKWESIIIDKLSESQVRATFVTDDVVNNKLNQSDYYFQYKQLIIDSDYQIFNEQTLLFNYDNMCLMDMDEDYTREWDSIRQNINDEYIPCTINLPRGMTIQEAIYNQMPHLKRHEEKYNVGGVKIIGELSADQDGIYTSRNTSSDNTTITLYVKPLYALKVVRCYYANYIYNLICRGLLVMIDSEIESSQFYKDDDGKTVINLGPLSDDDIFRVTTEVENVTPDEIYVEIPKGTMIEAVNNDVQNIVTTKSVYATIPPRQRKMLSIPAVCAAKNRKTPTGSKARFTPYMMSSYDSEYKQDAVWNHQSDKGTNKIVFYAYGAGTMTDQNHKSVFGHAFAYVPGIGYIGYGSQNVNKNSLLARYAKLAYGTEGDIFDHAYLRKTATDSCAVYVTDAQLKNVQDMIRYYMIFTPEYKLGRNDCTSFVMDIADAAGVYYGSRFDIQWPMYFIERLKKYN